MNCVDVVAGIVFDPTGREVLLALRKPDQHQGDRWEFPGGKLEANESPADGLRRELLEEINVSVVVSNHRQTIEHDYADKRVRLHFRDVLQFSGQPMGLEGQQLRWVRLSKLPELRFPDANLQIVEQLVQMDSDSGNCT